LEAEVDHLTAHGADNAMLAERELASSMVRVLGENNVSIDANKFAA
jgi:hypothetical protein